MSRFLFILFMSVSVSVYGQSSDYDLSDKKIEFIGNKKLLQQLMDTNRHPAVYLEDDKICHQTIKQIGQLLINDKQYHIIYLVTDFGISCMRNNKILIFSNSNVLVAYYQHCLIEPVKVVGSELIAVLEDKSTIKFSFKNGFPESELLGRLNML